MCTVGIRVLIMRINIERYKSEGVETGWKNYRHIVRCANVDCCYVSTSAGTHVRHTILMYSPKIHIDIVLQSIIKHFNLLVIRAF